MARGCTLPLDATELFPLVCGNEAPFAHARATGIMNHCVLTRQGTVAA